MAVCGDGGFMMNSQEMETAVRLKLNLVVMILNDSAYGMIRWKQAVDGFPDFGMTFGNPDFVRYAESYGAKGSRVARGRGSRADAGGGVRGGGVHLVEVADRLFRECPRACRRTAQPFRGEGVDGGGALKGGAATGPFVAELATSARVAGANDPGGMPRLCRRPYECASGRRLFALTSGQKGR